MVLDSDLLCFWERNDGEDSSMVDEGSFTPSNLSTLGLQPASSPATSHLAWALDWSAEGLLVPSAPSPSPINAVLGLSLFLNIR
ncbi:hypothetical protein PGTUg99_022166 [Puccinia graminis f. sp. tritici]|uniref:Uncharacterized protein n=1 Tax=Puccinia graminis f. sp. tritici TaxID=56615 RepID=A0A5B0RN33_PUCGR|nr:hypothetical protein PGTUg99_022166 [Puccinia graminis f. sp. tritici]